MKKILVMVLFCFLSGMVLAGRVARIGARVYGYNGNSVHFEFVDSPSDNMEFPYKEGELMDFIVELDEPALLKVNTWLWMMVSPGDDIEVDVKYNGRVYEYAEFKGSTYAVALNSAIRDGAVARFKDRYKLNPLAAAITGVPVAEYCEASIRNLELEQKMLASVRKNSDSGAWAYILAELEGTYLSNFVNYPFIVSGIAKRKFEEVEPEGFRAALDGYVVRSDRFALKSKAYLDWLIDFCRYRGKLEGLQGNGTSKDFSDPVTLYHALEGMYEGKVREAVLFSFLVNVLLQKHDVETLNGLTCDFMKKYNRDRQHKKVLDSLLKPLGAG